MHCESAMSFYKWKVGNNHENCLGKILKRRYRKGRFSAPVSSDTCNFSCVLQSSRAKQKSMIPLLVYYHLIGSFTNIFHILNNNQQRKWVLATNLKFLIPISLEYDSVSIWYFKLRLFDLTEFMFELSKVLKI